MTIEFLLNGKKVEITTNVSPSLMLVEYIRNYAGLTGTKIACGEGGCGACVVHISYKQGEEIVNKSINSCLTPLHAVHGTSVTTIEGIGGEKSGKFHPIQEKLSEKHGSQCGFCSPGMSMSIYSYLLDNKTHSVAEAEKALDGNLCRCTGYRPILDTIQSLCSSEVDIEELGKVTCPVQHRQSFEAVHRDSHWHRVTSLAEFKEFQDRVKDYKIIAGATSRGIYKDEFQGSKVLVDISAIQELHKIEHSEKGVRIGASTSFNKLLEVLKQISKVYPSQQKYFSAFIKHISLIAGTPVRNNATLGGNIALKVHRPDFPSDLVTILAAAGANVEIVTGDIKVEVPVTRIKLDKSSIITSIYIPFARSNEHFLSYKIAVRHQNSHAYVNHSFRFVLSDANDSITESAVVFGALSPKTIQSQVSELLQGKKLDSELFEDAIKFVNQEVVAEGVPHPEYAKSLATNLFYKSLLKIFSIANVKIDPKILSATQPFDRPQSTGEKTYGEIEDKEKPLGQPVPKIEAKIQASGEATYSDDAAAKNRNTLFGTYVVSSIAAGKIKSIDISEAEKVDGFVSWVTNKDVPGSNLLASLFPGITDFCFTESEIAHQGQMIGVIVGKTQSAAQVAAKKVKIEYITEGYKAITTIRDAIKANSFLPQLPFPPPVIARGDVEKTFQDPSLTILEGENEFGSQYAFYMEPQVTFAEPIDSNVMVLHSSTQDPTSIQGNVATVLNRAANKVQVVAKRVGGAFGSKSSQATRTAAAAAVCANKLGAPVTIALDRHTDIINIGKRHPFLSKYKVSVDKTGKIAGLKIELFCDAGYNFDVSAFVLFIAQHDLDNCYFLENVSIAGKLVKTNSPNNTAVRTFGGIQAIYFIESILIDIALKLNLPITKVQEVNFYKHGQTTPFGAPILEPDFTLHQVWPETLKNSQFFEKQKQIEEFNKENRWRKRGISIVPIRYSASYAIAKHGSEMSVYADGSVVIGTSGIDMGQGLNTKVAQTVSHYLGVPLDLITVTFTDTFRVANSGVTAGSFGSQSCIAAARASCDIMNERLAPFKKAKPDAPWQELCAFAVRCGAHLSVAGFFVGGKIVPNNQPQTPESAPTPGGHTPMDYISCGAGVTEVEVDVLTGEVQVLSAYVYYDTGKSYNPAVDIGQMEGGFVMGLGNVLTEEVTFSSEGIQLNDSTWTYKIPSSLDIPIHSSMHLFSRLPNERGMLRSKAASEGPMCVSVSVFFAVKHAVRAARADAGLGDAWFRFDPPATPHNIIAVTGTTLDQLKIHCDKRNGTPK